MHSKVRRMLIVVAATLAAATLTAGPAAADEYICTGANVGPWTIGPYCVGPLP